MDNIKIIRVKDADVIIGVKQQLTIEFKIVDMVPISFYLGLKVTQDQKKKTFKLFQPTYIDKIFVKF